MAHNLLAVAARGPALVHAHNSPLQREQSSMQTWEGRVEWWSAGALVSARLGAEYAFVATALGTIRHRGVDTPPAPRESPWFGYAPLDPAHLAAGDGLVFVKDVLRSQLVPPSTGCSN